MELGSASNVMVSHYAPEARVKFGSYPGYKAALFRDSAAPLSRGMV